jgi:hypothetical protein
MSYKASDGSCLTYDEKLSVYSNVENYVRYHLTNVRLHKGYVVPLTSLYDDVRQYCGIINTETNRPFHFNASDFNKLIGDLKKLGIVGVTRDGVYLMDAAMPQVKP